MAFPTSLYVFIFVEFFYVIMNIYSIAYAVIGGSSSRDRLLKERERYINMSSNQKKEELLLRNHEYKR